MKIGKYELILAEDNQVNFLTPDRIYIRVCDGEGREFSKFDLFKKLEATIDDFLRKICNETQRTHQKTGE